MQVSWDVKEGAQRVEAVSHVYGFSPGEPAGFFLVWWKGWELIHVSLCIPYPHLPGEI